MQSLWSLLRRAPRGRLLLLIVLLFAGSLTEGVGFVLLVPLLSTLTDGDTSNAVAQYLLTALDALGITASTSGLLAVFVGLVALRSVIQFAKDRTALMLQHRVVDDLRETCIRQLLHADWRWIAQQTRTDHMTLVMGEVNRVGIGLSAGLTLLTTLATAIAYLGVALLLSPGMAGLVMLAATAGYVAMRWVRRSASRLGSEQVVANHELMANVQQAFTGLKLTKILSGENRHIAQLVQTVRRVRLTQLRFGINTSLMRNLQQVIGAALLALYVLAGTAWLAVPVAELLALTFLFARLMPLLLSAQQFLLRWLNAEPALQAIDSFIIESAAHAEPASGRGTRSEGEQRHVHRQIKLREISLTYPDRSRPALRNVSLTLTAQTTTAITGPSGAGKSTLADILMGLIAPDDGTVEIDGAVLDDSSRQRWRRAVAYVPQDVFLFHDTVRANLLFGNPAASEQALMAALGKAAAGFVLHLPGGLDTVVGDNGVRLSGGERQRIALARALLRSPALLILDEATSALDVDNEQAIGEAIQSLHGGLTIVVIGHRLANLEHADQVVKIDAGTLTKPGGWDTEAANRQTPEG